MVLINIKIFNKFENLVILLSEQKFGDFGGGDYICKPFKEFNGYNIIFSYLIFLVFKISYFLKKISNL